MFKKLGIHTTHLAGCWQKPISLSWLMGKKYSLISSVIFLWSIKSLWNRILCFGCSPLLPRKPCTGWKVMRWLDLWEMFAIRELCCSCCLPLVALQFSHYSSPGYCSQSCSISTLINIFSVCWQYNHLSRRLSIIGSISPLHTHKGCHGDLRPALWRLPWHQCLPVFCWHGDLSASARMKQFKFAPVEHCWMFTDSWNGS